jgi:ADP-heptose:LPS heptosyltransferase
LKRALFKSHNRIGVGLNIRPALVSWHRNNPEYEIDLWSLPDTVDLYRGMKISLKVISEPEGDYDFKFDFDVNRAFALGHQHQCHIALAYAAMLQTRLIQEDYELVYEPEQIALKEREKNRILISPFSRSCSSEEPGQPPNKKLKDEAWKYLIDYLRYQGRIGVLGRLGDRFKTFSLYEDEYLTGYSFPRVAALLKSAKLCLTIDNGISHLAASQKAKTILFYPACLSPKWIVPIGNPNLLKVLQVDPATVHPMNLFLEVKKTLRESF